MKIKLAFVLLSLFLASASLAAEDQTPVEQLTENYQQAFKQGGQAFDAKTNTMTVFTPPPAQATASAPTDSEPQTCDCYSDSAYNYPANFSYSADQVRIKRINPACECKPHAAPKKHVAPVPVPQYTASPAAAPTPTSNDAPASSAPAGTSGSGAINPNFGETTTPKSDTSSSGSQSSAPTSFGITYN